VTINIVVLKVPNTGIAWRWSSGGQVVVKWWSSGGQVVVIYILEAHLQRNVQPMFLYILYTSVSNKLLK
jgi:hypothetical protein